MIVCNGDAAEGARAATATIPIVFVTAEDPVDRASLPISAGRTATSRA